MLFPRPISELPLQAALTSAKLLFRRESRVMRRERRWASSLSPAEPREIQTEIAFS